MTDMGNLKMPSPPMAAKGESNTSCITARISIDIDLASVMLPADLGQLSVFSALNPFCFLRLYVHLSATRHLGCQDPTLYRAL